MQAEAPQEGGIDKSSWGEGPWQSEPDRLQWQHAGYACLMVRHDRFGHWCGYVGIDSAHPFYGKSYETLEPDPDVHGGLTYAHNCRDSICHVADPGMPEDVWWLGFDCAHGGDLSPGLIAREATAARAAAPALRALAERLAEMNARHLIEDTYRTLAYVKTETESLAEQLREQASLKPALIIVDQPQ